LGSFVSRNPWVWCPEIISCQSLAAIRVIGLDRDRNQRFPASIIVATDSSKGGSPRPAFAHDWVRSRPF
jgi:hypothetical protein